MALSPMLVIGCGGSGGKVVLGLRKRIEAELRRKGWDRGVPSSWQFKWIDVPTDAESHSEFGPPLPLGDYVGLAPVDQYSLIDAGLLAGPSASMAGRLVGWRPTPNLQIPVSKGAGQMRAVGRSVALANTSKITNVVKAAFANMASGHAELSQLSELLNENPAVDTLPAVFVVSSMAGGTGAGIFIDVCDVVRAVSPAVGNKIFGFLFTAEIFRGVSGDAGMVPNTVASMSELLSGFLAVNRPAEPLFGAIGPVNDVGKSGPSWPYIIGMQPMGTGAPLESPAQCYRAVTETLLASIMNDKFAQAFVAYEITNFVPNSGAAKRQTAYQMLNNPVARGDGNQPCGTVSSFGSAIVSTGTGLFGEWGTHRLARGVIEHVTEGWREYGRQLMGDRANSVTSDPEIVDFLVGRDRQQFIESSGLAEENEPDGVKHDQVLNGILSGERMTELFEAYQGKVRADLAQGAEDGINGWVKRIQDVAAVNRSNFAVAIDKAMVEGFDAYGSQIVGMLGSAVSSSLAKFGVPVTQGLVKQLKDQCQTAILQLRSEVGEANSRAAQDSSPFIQGAFQALGKNKARGDSEYVRNGVSKALGSDRWSAAARRAERAAEFLERVVPRVLDPLMTQLLDVGGSLAAETNRDALSNWPDNKGSIGAAYRPAPTEKVLLGTDEWDTEYRRLLIAAAGSLDAARDEVAAGGFQFGSVANPKTASPMATFDAQTRWWERDKGHVTIHIRLRPEEVRERAESWFWNESHAVGKFVRMGLEEYLGEIGEHRARRLQRFEDALTRAKQLAQPLVNISPVLMQRMHPGLDSLEPNVVCEPFPFPPTMTDARAIVERVMYGVKAPEDGWFSTKNTRGTEKVLMTAVLASAVQPGTVLSLIEPVAQRWSAIRSTPLSTRQAAIRGFWTYNRARLITESIPLPEPSVEQIIKGWFVGRLLGLVTNATETEAFRVLYVEDNISRAAELPWPLLHHGETNELHAQVHLTKQLPALLEHLGLAMMMLGNDSGALDGYEHLYRIGARSQTLLEDWILNGTLLVPGEQKPLLVGTDVASRQEDAKSALDDLRNMYQKRRESTIVVGDWQRFLEIPYGYELFPLFEEALEQLHHGVATTETVSVRG